MTCTDDGNALLRAVIADPTDDTVRLAYADWLQEQGDELRAEFIRTQCEIDKGEQFDQSGCDVCGNTPDLEGVIEHGRGCYSQHDDGGGTSHADYTPRYQSLLERELSLFVNHRDQWFPVPHGYGFNWDIRLTSPFSDDRPAYVVRRGFVKSVTCTANQWLDIANEVLARNPITDVTLTTTPGVQWGEVGADNSRMCRFVNAPVMQWVRVDFLRWPTAAPRRIIDTLTGHYWPRIRFSFTF